MAKDPICGMDVNEETATKKGLMATKDGKKYYFCNSHCKEEFQGKKENQTVSTSPKDDVGPVPWYRSETFGKVFPWILAIVLIGGAYWSYKGDFMVKYMGAFFILFSLMKMLDWKGFVMAFSQYDLIAKRSKLYGKTYPAIEFIIGILFLTGTWINIAAYITIVIMGIGAIGVAKNMMSKNKIQCACLGTKINVPLTKVTLLEDVIMVVMAVSLII
jgi:YHS domain-containing protein